MSRRHLDLGAAGEAQVAEWYIAKGFEVLARNWTCADGELDLVLRKGRIVVFCEVKTRSTAAFGSPLHAVTRDKQRRIRHLAMAFLDAHPIRGRELRFDVAAVLPGSIEVVEAAF